MRDEGERGRKRERERERDEERSVMATVMMLPHTREGITPTNKSYMCNLVPHSKETECNDGNKELFYYHTLPSPVSQVT